MSSATVSLPLWAVFTVAFGSPLLSFLGVLVAQLIDRKSARELEARSRREETFRSLRWAAELAISGDSPRAGLGVAQLEALGESAILDVDQQLFVDAALQTTVSRTAENVDETNSEVELADSELADARNIESEGEERGGGLYD